MNDASSFLTVALAGTTYAMPLERVREVVSYPAVVHVPNAGASLRGVMNLRGSVVPVIDLARWLGLGDTQPSALTCAVLMETDIDGENAPIAALVEEIGTVVDLQQGELLDRPSFGLPVDPRVVRGVTAAGTNFAIVLDLDEVFATSRASNQA